MSGQTRQSWDWPIIAWMPNCFAETACRRLRKLASLWQIEVTQDPGTQISRAQDEPWLRLDKVAVDRPHSPKLTVHFTRIWFLDPPDPLYTFIDLDLTCSSVPLFPIIWTA